jgi:hypothetical protein
MNRPDVEKYEAMVAAATAGPWFGYVLDMLDEWRVSAVETPYGHKAIGRTIVFGDWPASDARVQEQANMELIAASREAIPELCAYVHELETLIRDWRGVCSQACGGSDECVRRAEEAGK